MFGRIEIARTGAYVAIVMSVGFITFHALPDGIPFPVRLAMVAVTQVAVGKAMQREDEGK